MPPQYPTFIDSGILGSLNSSTDSLATLAEEHTKDTVKKSHSTEYTQEQLLPFAKCFSADSVKAPTTKLTKLLNFIAAVPSVLTRYGFLLPIRCFTLGVSTTAFFISLPLALALKSNRLVSLCVKYYCKGILISLGVKVNYIGEKPRLNESHVFVANHTSYLDYILLSADKLPHAVVMARHSGVLGFLQNNGLNYLHSMTFDRSNIVERRDLSQSLRKHVDTPETWSNPMLIFPEGTCVNNKYIVRFQKGAFELGAAICPVGIKYDRRFGNPYWDTRKGFMHYAYYRMTRWSTAVDVVYCKPEHKHKGENAAQYGERIKEEIASKIGLTSVDFNGMAKRDLLKVLNEN